VTFFFARKESYPPPGRRSPLNPQKKPTKAKEKNRKRSDQTATVSSYKLSIKKHTFAVWTGASSYVFHSG
jgi:hypothetical protein